MTAPTPAKIAAEIRNTADRGAATNFHPIDGANTHAHQEQAMHNSNRNPAADYFENVFLEGNGTTTTGHGDALVHVEGDDIALTIPDFEGEHGDQHRLVKADAVDLAHAILTAAGETTTIDGNHVDPLGRIWQDIDHDGRRYTEYLQYEGRELRDIRDNYITVSTYRRYFDDGEVANTVAIEASNAELREPEAREIIDQMTKAIDALGAPTEDRPNA